MPTDTVMRADGAVPCRGQEWAFPERAAGGCGMREWRVPAAAARQPSSAGSAS
jgi:hypothetical protein